MPQPLYLQEITPVHTEYGAKYVLEPVWTFWRREISLVPTGIRTPPPPTVQPVAQSDLN